MSDKEIVEELKDAFKAGDTGIYHGNWFMILISENIQKELKSRIEQEKK
jgi:hypothetical protein